MIDLIHHLQDTLSPTPWWLPLLVPTAILWHVYLRRQRIHHGPLLALPSLLALLLGAWTARDNFLIVTEALSCFGETPNQMRAGGWSNSYETVAIGLNTTSLLSSLAALLALGRTRTALGITALSALVAAVATRHEAALWRAIRELDQPLDVVLHHAPPVHLLGATAAVLLALGLLLLATDHPTPESRPWSRGITAVATLVLLAAVALAWHESPAGMGPERLLLGHHWDPDAPVGVLQGEAYTRHPALLPDAPGRVQRAMSRSIEISHTSDLAEVVAWYAEHGHPFDRLVIEPEPGMTVGDLLARCTPTDITEGISPCLVLWPANTP